MNTPLLTPGERLALSRERLRLAIAEDARKPDSPLAALLTGGTGVLDLLKTVMPGAGEVIDALGGWWEQATLRPLAQRHPVGLVAGAVVAGIVLAWTRPWRWLFRPPLLTTLAPALLTSILASGHVQSWIMAMLNKEPATPEPRGDMDGL